MLTRLPTVQARHRAAAQPIGAASGRSRPHRSYSRRMKRSIARQTLLTPLVALLLAAALAAAAGEPADSSPSYGTEFWDHWGDGQAEIAAYELIEPRYGAERRGTAVAIFVTEDFSEADRVKAETAQGERAQGEQAQSEKATGDRFPVIKLNLVRDFPTGIYDYNLMTSAFVALAPILGRPAGAPTKVSFSAQEWCGHAYHQLLFDRERVRSQLHSYFEGEADRDATLDAPADVGSEDALLLWARRLAYPVVAPGEERTSRVVSSVARARLEHQPETVTEVRLLRSAKSYTLEVPAGTFLVRQAWAILGDAKWSFSVEARHPHRIVAWQSPSGEKASLVGSDRVAYWKLNAPGDEAALERIGLSPRPALTP